MDVRDIVTTAGANREKKFVQDRDLGILCKTAGERRRPKLMWVISVNNN